MDSLQHFADIFSKSRSLGSEEAAAEQAEEAGTEAETEFGTETVTGADAESEDDIGYTPDNIPSTENDVYNADHIDSDQKQTSFGNPNPSFLINYPDENGISRPDFFDQRHSFNLGIPAGFGNSFLSASPGAQQSTYY